MSSLNRGEFQRVPKTWLVRIYVGRDRETRRRKYVGKFIHGGLRSAQAHLNRMLSERDLARNIRSSQQTLSQYLDHWLDICARPRLSLRGADVYEYVRPFISDAPRDLQNGLYKLTFDGRVLSAQPRNGSWLSPTAT